MGDGLIELAVIASVAVWIMARVRRRAGGTVTGRAIATTAGCAALVVLLIYVTQTG